MSCPVLKGSLKDARLGDNGTDPMAAELDTARRSPMYLSSSMETAAGQRRSERDLARTVGVGREGRAQRVRPPQPDAASSSDMVIFSPACRIHSEEANLTAEARSTVNRGFYRFKSKGHLPAVAHRVSVLRQQPPVLEQETEHVALHVLPAPVSMREVLRRLRDLSSEVVVALDDVGDAREEDHCVCAKQRQVQRAEEEQEEVAQTHCRGRSNPSRSAACREMEKIRRRHERRPERANY